MEHIDMRGFISNFNFIESSTTDSDRRILDNLAGAGISSDIALFSNNTKNQSVITINDYIVENNQFILTNDVMLPYADNTIVAYGENQYIVKNSNLIDRFQLFDPDNLNSPFEPSEPYRDIVRNDFVSFENIVNLNPDRIQTKPIASSNDIDQYDPYTVYGINENIEAIEQSNELLEFKRISTILTDRENTINSPVSLTGTVTITNIDSQGVPSTDVVDSESPGLFINNGSLNIRAFSDSSQPWNQITGGLSTNSSNTNIGTLIMSDPSISGINVTAVDSEVINTSLKNEYYSVPVTINNELYYLLCRKVI
jgi:hypothetical protein